MSTRLTREELRDKICKVANSYDLDLYDLEYPSLESGTLRVFISRQNVVRSDKAVHKEKNDAVGQSNKKSLQSRDGVSLEECAKVSREIINWLEEQQVPGSDEWSIEVSSPGINRKLRTIEHFKNAIGERVKVCYRNADNGGKKTSLFRLEDVEADKLGFASLNAPSAKKQKRSPSAAKAVLTAKQLTYIDFADIESAHVDFDFN